MGVEDAAQGIAKGVALFGLFVIFIIVALVAGFLMKPSAKPSNENGTTWKHGDPCPYCRKKTYIHLVHFNFDWECRGCYKTWRA